MTSSNHTYRVLMIIPFLRHIGGMEKQSFRLAKELNKQGVHVSFLTTARPWEFIGERRAKLIETIEGFRVITIPGIYIPIMKNFPFEFLFWGVLYLLLKRRSFDIFHGHQLFSSGVVVSAGTRLFDIPSLVKLARSGEGGDAFDILNRPFRKMKLKIFSSMTRFVAMTPEFVNDLQTLAIPPEKIVEIPNGVDTERFRPPSSQEEKRTLRRTLHIPTDRPVVFWDSRLSPSKRPEYILEAWKTVHAKHPEALLVSIGRGGFRKALPDHLLEYIQTHQLSASVQFRGVMDNPEDFARVADIFTLGARTEGVSNSLLQAASSGLAVAVPDNAGNRMIVQHEKTGYLADVDDAQDLARHLIYLLDHPEKRRTLGEAARKHVEEHLSLTSVADAYLELYDTISR